MEIAVQDCPHFPWQLTLTEQEEMAVVLSNPKKLKVFTDLFGGLG